MTPHESSFQQKNLSQTISIHFHRFDGTFESRGDRRVRADAAGCWLRAIGVPI